MRKHIWVVIALTLIFSACGAPPQVQVKDWPMKDKDATGNRVVVKDEKFEYPKTNVVAWKQYVYEPTQPIVADGKVFVLCRDFQGGEDNGRILTCFDAFTGKLLWSEKYDITRSPVFSNGNLFFMQTDGTIVCINSQNRKKVWSNKVGGDGYYYKTLVENGYFVFIDEKSLTCVDEKTGEKLWGKTFSKYGVNPMVSCNGRLYYTHIKELFCINLEDGKQLWNLECTDYIRNLVAYGDNLFYDDSNSTLHCLDRDGRKLWKTDFVKPGQDGHECGLTYCVVDGKVYAIDVSDKLYCLDAGNGVVQCSRPVSKHDSNITYYDDCIYYRSGDRFQIVDVTDKGRSFEIKDLPDGYLYSLNYGNIYQIAERVGLFCVNAKTGTSAITYKQIKSLPVQITTDDKYWVGELENNLRIFKDDRLVWKNSDKVSSFSLGDDKYMNYLDYANHIVYIGYGKDARFVCIAKTSGKTVWEKPLEDFTITGYDKKTLKLENNYGKVLSIDVASGKTESGMTAPIKKGLDEFTEFAISLVYAPGEFNFYKINEHQYLINQYGVGGKGMYELGLFVANDDGSVLYALTGTSDYEGNKDLDFLSYRISSDKSKLYVKYNLDNHSEGHIGPTSKEVDLATGKVTDFKASEDEFPQGAIEIGGDYFSSDNPNPNSIIKKLPFWDERMSDADFEKRTGLKPLKFEKAQYDEYFTPSASNYIQKINNSTICYRVVSSPGPDRDDVGVDYMGIFDSKTWKNLWKSGHAQTNLRQVGDKYLLVECDIGISLVDLTNGKVVFRLDNTEDCSIIDDVLFVAQRKNQNRKSVIIKAVNLKKIVEKFK